MRVSKSYYVVPNNKASLIAESFGITGSYENKICDFELPSDFSILYITGESGSGKSTILKEIVGEYQNEFLPLNKPLFLWLGDKEEEQIKCIKYLSLVGISDAILFLNYFDNLSDSQKSRVRIMMEILSDKKVIVIDEFLSTLDRETAKSVAFCVQKVVRKLNKKAIFCTAHEDLEQFLFPEYTIKGTSFPSDFKIIKNNLEIKNIILNEVEFWYGSKDDYKKLRLGELHYKGKYTGGTKEFLFGSYKGRIISCLVSTYNMHTKGRRISRVVVHPSYRSIGIGTKMIKKYLNDFKNVDVVASMALYNPVFEKANMIRVEDSINECDYKIKKDLSENGFDFKKWYDRSYCELFCKEEKNRILLSKYSSKFTHLIQPGGKKFSEEEVSNKLREDYVSCGRVLFHIRDKRMAKYKSSDFLFPLDDYKIKVKNML